MRRQAPLVTEKDVPPVNKSMGKATKCGWCKSVIGEEHKSECVTRQRSVVLRLTLEFVSTVPESWDQEALEFYHNGNTFCSSNYLDQLAKAELDNFPCFCDSPPGETGLRYVREADERDEQLLPWAYRWGRD